MKCIICGEPIFEGSPCEITSEGFFCGDCAFINNYIEEKEYIKKYLFWICLDGLRATVFNGKIYVSAYNQPFEFEIKTQDYRKTKEYKAWRAKVFDRDGFKCQICGQVGGTLNAHHIKEFSRFPKLRYDVDNGVTLCECCHREIHRKKV